MSYNGSGTFNINTSGQPVVTGTVISSTAFNALTADLGTGLSTAITKDGQTVATARIPFAQGINSSLVTDATSTTTGSIITAGGAGIAKALYVGTTLNVAGASTLAAITGTFNGTVGATTPSTGAFTTLSATGTITKTNTAATNSTFLSVSGSTTGNAFAGITNTGGNFTIGLDGSTGGAFPGTTAYASLLWNFTNTPLQIGANNALVATFSSTGLAVTGTLTSTGNLGAGIASPAYRLDVRVTSTGNVANFQSDSGPNIRFTGTETSGRTYQVGEGLVTAGSFSIYDSTGSAERLVINSSGNLGIGTSSPTVYANQTNLAINGTNYGRLDLMNGGTVRGYLYGGAIGLTMETGGALPLMFATSGTERMRIDSSGIVTMNAYGAGAATFSAAGVISSVSDETWKVKDGAPVDTDAMLNKLEPGYWYYNDEKKETFGKDRQLGFYAQNVNAAIGPEAAPEPETVVTKNDDGTETSVTKPWGYYDRSVLAVTVMSLQKALATIESLTARITTLEAK